MLSANQNQSRMMFQLNQFYNDRVLARKLTIARSVRDVCRCIQDVLREVETQEPRFISSLQEVDGGHFEGVRVLSPTEFEVILYLNQMGIFNFVDDGAVPGCAVLKLSDGRKRSMSLWVEFITASGYLSARKIRSRFQTLVAQAVEKCSAAALAAAANGANGSGNGSSQQSTSAASAMIKMVPDTTEVRLRIRDRYTVQITPAFKCVGIWPRSAAHWPAPSAATSGSTVNVCGIRQLTSPPPTVSWPGPALVAEVKAEGFDLLSKESPYTASGGNTAGRDKQPSTDGDAWIISFHQAESLLLAGGSRRRCLSVLKTLRDRHLDLPGRPVDNYHLTTLVLYECEKHPRDTDWDESCLGDRVNGVLLQLISCLQNRRCPHYFLPGLDLFKAKAPAALDSAARQAWRILRELVTNSRGLEKL